MALDFPASGAALWGLYDAGGPRPEYVLPSLFLESGFRPDIQNQAGAPYYGLNQISGDWLQARGISVDDYLTWPASQQIQKAVKPYVLAHVAQYGPIRSATRFEQSNFLPATLKTATDLDSVLTKKGDHPDYYSPNKGLDTTGSGAIRVSDLATKMAQTSALPQVRDAISKTYALRPNESPRDPVYGEDFGGDLIAKLDLVSSTAVPFMIVGVGASLYALYQEGYLDSLLDRIRRFLGR